MQLAHRLLSTRSGTIAVSVFAAALAAVIVFAYLHRYRQTVSASSKPTSVLVANAVIEKGTPGSVIGAQELFQVSSTPRSEVKEGAITDPALLRGKIATADIYPGEQLSVADFSAAGADAIGNRISGEERAIAVPLDKAHGMIGNVAAGDHVDLYAGFNVKRLRADGTPDPDAEERPVLRLLVEDVVVLAAPEAGGVSGGGGQTAEVTVRVDEADAARTAFAADNGKVWVVLRPRTGAKPTPPDLVTIETVLFGVKPITAMQSFGGAR